MVSEVFSNLYNFMILWNMPLGNSLPERDTNILADNIQG